MRSVPIIIDKNIRHLRYTFAAVEDLDTLLPGGFLSVFDREADTSICHLLLWAGLSHEGVTYEEVGMYLAHHQDISSLWKTITFALVNDEWISVTPKEDTDGEKKTLPEIISSIEKIAASEFNLISTDFYGLTPREFSLLQVYFGMRDNLRTGIVCATMANIHAKKKNDRPFEPKDFIRVGEPEKPQTVNDQSQLMMQIMGGGLT